MGLDETGDCASGAYRHITDLTGLLDIIAGRLLHIDAGSRANVV